MKYSIIVAEDEALLLENLVKKIETANVGFEVIGSAQTGIQAYELVEELNPDVLITDIRMPAMDGLELIQKISEMHPRMDCIITSGYSDFEYARTAIKYRVTDYLLKPVDIEELKTALRKLRDRYVLEQNALEDVFRNTASKTPAEIAALLKEFIIQHFIFSSRRRHTRF